MTRQDRPAPGVVHVRLTGVPADAAALAAVLAATPAVQILTGPDGPYPSRRQPGHRLYLTVRLTQPPMTNAPTGQRKETPMTTDPATTDARPRSSRPGRADPLHADPASRNVPGRPARRAEPGRAGTGGSAVTTSAPAAPRPRPARTDTGKPPPRTGTAGRGLTRPWPASSAGGPGAGKPGPRRAPPRPRAWLTARTGGRAMTEATALTENAVRVQGPARPGSTADPDLGDRDHGRHDGRPRRHLGPARGRRGSRTGRLHRGPPPGRERPANPTSTPGSLSWKPRRWACERVRGNQQAGPRLASPAPGPGTPAQGRLPDSPAGGGLAGLGTGGTAGRP